MNIPSFKSLAIFWILLLLVIVINTAWGLTQDTSEPPVGLPQEPRPMVELDAGPGAEETGLSSPSDVRTASIDG